MAYTSVDDPTIYFNTILWTGNGADRTITTDHATDWIWMKDRDQSIYHRLTDSVRGAAKALFTNTNDSEQSDQYGTVGSFTSTGFTIRQGASNSTYVGANENNIKYVGWSWVAGGSASSNSNGSITSSVSANTTAGFSIVSWTGTAANATVGHGLGVAPKVIIVKNRIDTTNWNVFHESVGNTGSLYLNSNQTTETYQPFWNNTSPTSSVFTVGSDGATNGSSDAMIAYCFADVQGYSKFGSYTGNGNADGAFVYCGFEPAFVIIKGAASGDGTAAQHWEMYDNKRNVFTPQNKALFPSLYSAESTESRINFLSNGFKAIINSDGVNDNNSTYIFMAFAESPFVNSNGVPNNAR